MYLVSLLSCRELPLPHLLGVSLCLVFHTARVQSNRLPAFPFLVTCCACLQAISTSRVAPQKRCNARLEQCAFQANGAASMTLMVSELVLHDGRYGLPSRRTVVFAALLAIQRREWALLSLFLKLWLCQFVLWPVHLCRTQAKNTSRHKFALAIVVISWKYKARTRRHILEAS